MAVFDMWCLCVVVLKGENYLTHVNPLKAPVDYSGSGSEEKKMKKEREKN